MTTMISYQVETFGKPLAQVLRETPSPQGTQVLVQVKTCGVCHSDVHLHDGYFDLGLGNKIDMTRGMNLPRTLGHEIAGTVVAVGPDAVGVAVGDERVVYPWIGCGECATCKADNEHLCNASRSLGVQRDGGFSSHVLVPHARYLLDFAPLPAEQACTYACAGITAYSALKKAAPLAPGDTLLIIGAGGVGLSAIRLARQMLGVAPTVVEIDQSKWDMAREAGAGELIDPSTPGALKALLKATGGGVAVAIDYVGAAATFEFGFGALRKGGKLVCVGLFGGAVTITPVMMSMRSVTITGSYVGSLQEMHELMAIARSSVLPAMPITLRPLADATLTIEALKAGHIRGRTVLVP